ncbi:hypothetical protein FG386_003411 [Cryptosporidium ryanae]|uniref:uncharacterized protein n=1 Tax=Cryptosporidium ryanae TaxID=515981 RepID=UPI003519D83E|nr:hypothetical protein FG386_003411 [Cryptosporidium ryanae]
MNLSSIIYLWLVILIVICNVLVLGSSTTKERSSTSDSQNKSNQENGLRHAQSKYSGMVPRHQQTNTSILYGRMNVLNWYLVRRKNTNIGPLRYGLNSDDMHVTFQMYVNNLRTHIPVQKTYLHERQKKARKIRRKYAYLLWRRWRYLLSAKERMPILVDDENLCTMPIDPLERVYYYGVELIEIPSLFYLENLHCMYSGIKPFVNGLLPSYSLQDLMGASLFMIGIGKKFKEYLCIQAVNLWSDDSIVPHSKEICSRVKKCLSSNEFESKKYKPLVTKYSKRIDEIYQGKRHMGADSAKAYAEKAFQQIVNVFHTFEAHKRPDYIEKLFVIVRAIRFMIYANELLIKSGVKKKPVFKAKKVADVIQYSVFRVEPVSMVRFCVAHFLTVRFKFRKNMGIAVIEEACAHSLSFGFIDDTGKLPDGVTRSQARDIIYKHFQSLEEEAEESDDFMVIQAHDQNIHVDHQGNIVREEKEDLESEELNDLEEDTAEDNAEEENKWERLINDYIE